MDFWQRLSEALKKKGFTTLQIKKLQEVFGGLNAAELLSLSTDKLLAAMTGHTFAEKQEKTKAFLEAVREAQDIRKDINARAFENPQMWLWAQGVDTNEDNAVVSTNGQVLFYSKTGGMMKPRRHVLQEGDVIYRFGASGKSVQDLMQGAWWIAQPEMEKLLSFAQQHRVGVGVAVRALALVPPQWSDLGRLIRVRVRRRLLAMRGLGESVHIAPKDELGTVSLTHQNHNPARRLYQLFIPGLSEPGFTNRVFEFGNVYDIDPEESIRGFLYL